MSTPNPLSFTVKDLRFTFTLANNAVFAGTNSNVLQVNGLRAAVTVMGSGLPAFPSCDIEVYGLLQQDMVALTALAFQPLALQRNTAVVEANSGGGWSTVFAGQIITGGPDYSGAPRVPYKANCRVLGFESLNPATPTSYTGTTSVAAIASQIAAKMGYAFVNQGVTSTLESPYFPNTLAEQLRALQRHTGVQVYIENNTITIAPNGTPLSVPTFDLSPDSGLEGWPKLDYQRGFVNATSLYNPAFRFGGPITVSGSQVVTANGSWMIGTIKHRLSAQMPKGPWFTDMLLYPPDSGIPPS